MEFQDIPKSAQENICGQDRMFYAILPYGIEDQPDWRTYTTCCFLRMEICPGFEKLSVIIGSDSTQVLFGYYNRRENVLDFYMPGLEKVKDSLIFKLGPHCPLTSKETNAIAIDLIAPFIFLDDDSLNEEELDLLPIVPSGIGPDISQVFWFAAMLYANPNKSFRSILPAGLNRILFKKLESTTGTNIISLDEIVRVQFLEGDTREDIRHAAQTILCDSNGYVTRSLRCAWRSFLSAKEKIDRCSQERREMVADIYKRLRKASIDYSALAITLDNGEKVEAWISNALNGISLIGIYNDAHDMIVAWENVEMLKSGRKIIWRRT